MRNAKQFTMFLALLAPVAALAATPLATDSSLANGDLDGVSILDDAPYENVENPGAPLRAGWKLHTGYTGSQDESSDLYSGYWTSSVSKSWFFPALTPSLKASWTNSDLGELGSNSGTFTAGLSWAPFDAGAFYAQGAWTTQEGPDEPAATVGTWWDIPLGEIAGVGLDGTGGWSQISDFDGHLGVSFYAEGKLFSLDLGGGWDYRKIDFVDVTGISDADYQNVWSAQAGTRFLWGNWSTGPSWSFEYWKAEISTMTTTSQTFTNKRTGVTKHREYSSVVPADGISLNQEFSWNLGWKPLLGWSLDLSGFRTLGQASLSTKQSSTPEQQVRRNLKQSSETQFSPPEDAWGGSVSLSIGW